MKTFGLRSILLVAMSQGLLSAAEKSLRYDEGTLLTRDEQGTERWRAKWTRESVIVEGESLIRFTETGEGHYSPFEESVRWKFESLWSVKDRFTPQRYQRDFSSLEDEPLMTEKCLFDWQKRVATCEKFHHGTQERETARVEVPLDTLTPEGIPTFLLQRLKGVPAEMPRASAHILTSNFKLYEVTFKMDGQEEIDSPAGRYICLKVKMDVNLGLFSLLKAFVPDTFFWFTLEEPHFWVRYQGLESGRGSPRVTRELTSFKPSAAEAAPGRIVARHP